MIENENAENLYFQLGRLQAEGKSVGVLRARTEQIIFQKTPIDETMDEIYEAKKRCYVNRKKEVHNRPRWEIKNQDEGVIIATKNYKDGARHMDILEGKDPFTGEGFKSIIIYDNRDEEHPVMIRNYGKKRA